MTPNAHFRRRSGRAALLAAVSLLAIGALCGSAMAAPALPTGGRVQAGVALIGAPAGGSLTVSQSSARAIIDWASFSIGSGGAVKFDNGSGATLNRVTGAFASQIDGALFATGSVYLLNPNGVVVGRGGAISVGGTFVASTLGLSNSAFMNGGNLTFSGASSAPVVNAGDITAAGDVALIGATVENDGQIQAPNGTAALAAGHSVAMDAAAGDDGKLQVLIGGPQTSATNTSLIEAANAELRANGGNVYALAVGTGSKIAASGVSASDGHVFLVAGAGGRVTARGEIDATRADGSGGAVETSGGTVDFTGLTVKAANWLIDPVDLTVDSAAASTIGSNLATTSVTLQTTASGASGPGVQSPGAGDIVVDAPISWSSANGLTLDAYHSIAINADITASGPGKVTLTTNDGGTGGDYGFGPGASLSFTGAPGGGQALTINGQAFTLVYSQSDLTNINNNLAGFYALAAPLDLTGTIFTAAPIANASDPASGFTGTFTGLGNAISNLTIDETNLVLQTGLSGYPSNGSVGLIGTEGAGGVVEDIALANAHVTGGDGMQVGALVGQAGGSVINASSSGMVSSGNSVGSGAATIFANAGGLVGGLGGSIVNSQSNASVAVGDGFAGGLAGTTGPGSNISGSHASGNVATGADTGVAPAMAGGLVGIVYGYHFGGVNPVAATVSGSYATGAVSGGGGSLLGGLIGDLTQGQVTTSWSTGSVTQTAGGQNGEDSSAGGFVGYMGTGASVTQSWSGGAVNTVGSSGAPIPGAAAGLIYVTFVGGFVGDMDQASTVSQSYATGSVTSTGSNFNELGGFGGAVFGGAGADHVYATGLVSGAGNVAGLVGLLGCACTTPTSGFLTDAYWDEGTTGRTNGYNISGTGSATNVTGIGGSTGISPYAAATYANFAIGTTWALIEGLTRPVLLSEYSTTITNAHQLELMNVDLTAHYTLAGDIDASETSNPSGIWNPANAFVPIGGNGAGRDFTGSLDGAGYTIGNLTVIGTTPTSQATPLGYSTDREVGLFGLIGAGSLVENINLANVHATGGDGTQVGALAGVSVGTIANASTSGVVATGSGDNVNNAPAAAGGLVGGLGGTITNSHSSATVSGAVARVGGLVGETVGGAISGSSASGAVSDGDASATLTEGVSGGGLVGYLIGASATSPTVVTESYSTGAVSGGAGSHIGGFAGLVQYTQITNAWSTGSVTQAAPGVNARNIAGGFAALIGMGGVVTQSWSEGAVTTVGGTNPNPNSVAGGFVGDVFNGTVSQSYSLGAVTSTGGNLADLGGFAGIVESGGSVSQVYATGLVSGAGNVAGLVALVGLAADSDTSGSLTNSYWDEGTTGQTVGYNLNGTGSAANVTGIGGSTGLSPYAGATYANFDLTNTWVMIEGETRPVLRSEYSTTITNSHQLELMGLNLAATYTLAGNIDASDTISSSGAWNPANGFVPVGGFSMRGPFTGTLDGQGHTISNLTIVDATQASQPVAGFDSNGAVGLIGVLGAGGVVQNVNLAGAHVTGGDGEWVGALIGANTGSVINDSSSGVVTGGSSINNINQGGSVIVGGLAGASIGQIADSQSSATVVAGNDAFAGGLVGAIAAGGSVANSSASGNVSVGGQSASNTGNSQGTLAGGLVGLVDGYHQGDVNPVATPVTGSFATGNVTGGAGSFIGGFVGSVVQGQINTSYATGAVTQTAGSANGNNDIAGGFAGVIDVGGSVSQSFASGAVNVVGGANTNGATLAGGFVGGMRLGATVSNAYATGAVTSTGSAFADLGGFAGVVQQSASVDHAYATGLVSGPGTLGGLVGQVGDTIESDTSGAISDSYWDEGTTGQTVGYNLVGTGTATNVSGMGGSTGVSPFTAATYAGWDFANVWSAPSAGFYPQLYGVSHVLRITVGTTSSVYGAFPIYTFTVYGLQPGDTPHAVAGLFVTPTGATSASSGFTNAGSYALTPSGATAGDPSGTYRLIYVNGSSSVTQRPVSASLTGSVEKTYDGTTAATLAAGNYQLAGAIAGDNVALNDPASGSYDTKNVGTGKMVSVAGLALTGSDASNYTVNSAASAPIGIIDPAALMALIASLTGTVEKTYDGTTTATLSPANYLLAGPIVAGDSVALNDPTIGTYDTPNVGAGKTVTVGGLALTGAQASNYTVNSAASAPIGIVDPKALNALLTGTVQKTYDGATVATLMPANYQLSGGVVSGENVALNDPASGTYDSKDVGTEKTVSVGGLALTGADAGNYTVNGSASASIGSISAKALIASLTGTVERQYDGTTVATLAGANYQLAGAIAGDNVALNDPASGGYDTKTVGTGKTVSVMGLALTGSDAGNYTVNGSVSASDGVIDQRVLTASLTGTVQKPYDGATTATLTPANYQLSGVVSGENVALNDPTSGTYDTAAPGAGKTVDVTGVALTGSDASDYTVSPDASGPVGVIVGNPAPPIQVTVVTVSPAADLVADTTVVDNSSAAGPAGGGTSSTSPTSPTSVVGIFPVIGAPPSDFISGDNSPVTGAGNGDLWAGSGLDEPCDLDKGCKR